ncbi:MAG: tetratricopeptide repeat protein [Candidatus Heimdallarchaeota archaeon]
MQDLLSEEFRDILTLIYNSEFEEAVSLINNLAPEHEVEGNILRLKMYFWSGKYDRMSELMERLLSQKLTTIQQIRVLQEKAILLIVRGESKEALKASKSGKDLLETTKAPSEFDFLKAEIEFNLAIYYELLGDLKSREVHYKECVKAAENTENFQYLILGLMNLGYLYQDKGNIPEALNFYRAALEYESLLPDSAGVSHGYDHLARIYRDRGEINPAIEYATKAQRIRKKAGMGFDVANSFWTVGTLYRMKGDNERALESFKRSIEEYQKISNTVFWISCPFYYACITLVDQRELKAAQEYLEQLEEVSKKGDDPLGRIHYKLALAIYLKAHERLKEKIQAQTILEELIADEAIVYDEQKTAMLHLVELLVDEYKLYKNTKVLETIQTLITKLTDFANQNYEFPLAIKTLIVNAKIYLVQGQGRKAQELVSEAKAICEMNDLHALSTYVRAEEQTLTQIISEWSDFAKQNETVIQKMEQLEVDDYLTQAAKLLLTLNGE